MGERIKAVKSPTLTVNAAGDGFDDNTAGEPMWSFDSTNKGYISPVIDGEIQKIILNFGTANTDTSADLTVATRDTPSENILALSGADWTKDVTHYPKVLAVTNAAGALTDTANQYTQYVVKGSVLITCASATDNDTVILYIYYR